MAQTRPKGLSSGPSSLRVALGPRSSTEVPKGRLATAPSAIDSCTLPDGDRVSWPSCENVHQRRSEEASNIYRSAEEAKHFTRGQAELKRPQQVK